MKQSEEELLELQVEEKREFLRFDIMEAFEGLENDELFETVVFQIAFCSKYADTFKCTEIDGVDLWSRLLDTVDNDARKTAGASEEFENKRLHIMQQAIHYLQTVYAKEKEIIQFELDALYKS